MPRANSHDTSAHANSHAVLVKRLEKWPVLATDAEPQQSGHGHTAKEQGTLFPPMGLGSHMPKLAPTLCRGG